MHPVEIGLSFLEGLLLIASPCILPVLPLILSTSVDGGHRRPFGIISGFVIAFSLFALLSRELVAVLHINLDYIKYGSLILLALFGVVLLSEKLQTKFSNLTQGFASTGTTLSANARDGFFSGVLIGILIGLVWTPCAGPILAVALVQIIREQNSLNAVFLILAFAIGAGIPMLIISLTGRKLMHKLTFLNTHAGIVRKFLGVLVLIAVAFIASGFNPQNIFAISTPQNKISPEAVSTEAKSNRQLQDALPNPYPAPPFASSNMWLNTPDNKPLTIASLKGKVVLVDFWTYSCINCIRTLPYMNDWYKKYHDKRLVIIGVHAPEFEFEKNKDNVIKAIAADGIQYPVAMDNNLDTWTNYNNRYWPAHYLIDKNGNVVYTHFGEGEYQETENNIRFLLGLDKEATNIANNANFNANQTPETYLGYERGQAYSGVGDIAQNMVKTYAMPTVIPANKWALSGQWLVEGQKIVTKGNSSHLSFNFNAQHVYLVLGNPDGKPIDINVKLNGQPAGLSSGHDAPHGIVTVNGHRLYELINQGQAKSGLLELDIFNPNVEAYAFTFG
jgi:cytochrome c biogenesis protein CcdA/thiol-disulfide isomerase/thioredoxin